jgi:NAD-dependent deacetylase
MSQSVYKLHKIISESKRILFFTGAGVSVKSGIPDFRSMGGLFDEIYEQGYDPEYLLSINHLEEQPESFVNFYKKRLLLINKKPNPVHQYIQRLEHDGTSLGVITQNIDGLHYDAGSKNVDELHGSLARFYCTECHRQYSKDEILSSDIRFCECGGVVRPDITLYGEMLDENTVVNAMSKLENADTLIVLGSSLVVNPAAYLTTHFKGKHFVIINKDKTPYDDIATLVINEDMTDVVNQLEKLENN